MLSAMKSNMKIKLEVYYILLFFVFTSCTSDNASINANPNYARNKSFISNQNEEVIKAYSDFLKHFENESVYKLSGIYATPIDLKTKYSHKNPSLIFFLHEMGKDEFMTQYYVDSNKVICFGHMIEANDQNFKNVKYQINNSTSQSQDATFIRQFLDPDGLKTIEDDYNEWARHLPFISKKDTISSDGSLITQKYNETYLPKNAEIIGKVLTISDNKENLFFILYNYKVNGKSVPYIELYNKAGKRKYRHLLFDSNFTNDKEKKYSRFYLTDRYMHFENYQVIDNIEVSIQNDSIDLAIMNELYF